MIIKITDKLSKPSWTLVIIHFNKKAKMRLVLPLSDNKAVSRSRDLRASSPCIVVTFLTTQRPCPPYQASTFKVEVKHHRGRNIMSCKSKNSVTKSEKKWSWLRPRKTTGPCQFNPLFQMLFKICLICIMKLTVFKKWGGPVKDWGGTFRLYSSTHFQILPTWPVSTAGAF